MAVARLSAWTALACKNPDFWRFLQVDGEQAAIEQVRARCAVASRSEFDRDPDAAAQLHKIIRHPFITHQEQHNMATKNATPAAPDTTIQRDVCGYGFLPAFMTFALPDEDLASGAVVNGNEVHIIKMIDDSADMAAHWMAGNSNISKWIPTRPEGDDWNLALIGEHEEGPYAVWARPGIHGVLTGKDYAQEFLLGSLIKACTKHLKTLSKPWGEMKEGEQQRVMGAVGNDCRDAVRDAIDIIASNGRLTFPAAVDQVVFKDGVKVVLSLAKGDWAHSLADAEGGYVTIVIEERSKLLDEGDALEVEKDQKSLLEA